MRALQNQIPDSAMLDLSRFRSLPAHTDEPGPPVLDSRQLLRRALLHLPRFTRAELEDSKRVQGEIARVAAQLQRAHADAPVELRKPRPSGVTLSACEIVEVPPPLAAAVHRSFHYLGTAREGSLHLGLRAPRVGLERGLLALATFSKLDVPHLIDSLAFPPSSNARALVLSRLFAFASAPKNTMSYLLGRACDRLRQQDRHLRVVFTYLNPNLGFHGTVYRASNWRLYGFEYKRRYLYLDGDYLTERRALELFGSCDEVRLARMLGPRFARSLQPLRPLEIYARWLRHQRASLPLHFEPSAPQGTE